MEKAKPTMGIITARKCPTCGHHELGYETRDGRFFPLRPGDRVGVIPGVVAPQYAAEEKPLISHGDEEKLTELDVWVPDPLRCNNLLSSKYGVLFEKDRIPKEMSASHYEMAYRQKLKRLIEKEEFAPLPIILDRYFAAPNLATGDSKQIAEALWEELEEIRKPVLLVQEWLALQNDETLTKMIHPRMAHDLTGETIDDEQLREELESLSLEGFFEML
jgi:hypothetical protein